MFFRKSPRFHIGGLAREAVEACVAIHASAFHRGWEASEFASLLSDPSVIASAALDARAGAPLGFILARRALDEAEILTVAVDAKARRGGIGKALLDDCLARLTNSGVKSVFLEVDATSKAALALYARARFVRVGERRGYYARADGPAASALILRRDA